MLDADPTETGVTGDGEADLDLVAIGNPLLDIIDTTTDEELARLGLVKGAMTLIDLETATAMEAVMRAPRFVSGGSVANTAVGFAQLGGRAGFIGAVADDEVGHRYTEDLRAAGVFYEPTYGQAASVGPLGTGRCNVLMTDDAERTMGTYLGAASTLTSAGVPTAVVERASVVLLEGYLADVPAAMEAMRQSAVTAHGADGSVALSLSDPFLVDRHRRAFLEMLLDDIDILIGNEEEMTKLFGATTYTGALKAAEETGLLVVMTRGGEGSVVLTAHGPEEVAASPAGEVVDTNGAGDLFASGFLFGLTQGMSPGHSARLGGLCAAEVISHTGARPETDLRALAVAAGALVP